MMKMMDEYDLKDWLVFSLFMGIWVVATIILFKHQTIDFFGAWCGLVGTTGPIFHWLTQRDDKVPDAPQ
jgi:hypothetical protein